MSAGATTGTGIDGVDRAARRAFRLSGGAVAGAVAALLLSLVISATQGAAGLPIDGVVRSLLNGLPLVEIHSTLTPSQEAILWSIRLPRTVLGALVGACLAMSGAAFQGVFRNPLADPYLLGVSAGAGLGAVLAIGFDLDLSWGIVGAIPAAAFAGALVAVSGSALIARGSFSSPATLLLSGIAIAALFAALQTFALQQLNETRAREALSWLFGQLTTHGWDQVLVLLPYMVFSGLILLVHGRHLDVLRMGDDEARALGLHPSRTRFVVVLAATLMTAAAVSVSGLIAFVGLVIPHIVRLVTSHSYRVILPLSAVIGAAFLAFVDVGARTLAAPAELPVGVFTAFVGAPFFAFILWRGSKGGT